MTRVFVGLGSNLGYKRKNIQMAIKKLNRDGIRVGKCSKIYQTAPYGVRVQPSFLNAVVELETEFTPRELLRVLKNIEKDLGRCHRGRWQAREIDLDILFYGQLILEDKDLSIPHYDFPNRYFVLRPFLDIDPNFIHPVFKKTIKELYEQLRG